MLDIWGAIDSHLMSSPPLKTERLPTLYPSQASCRSAVDGQPIGACIRANWYRIQGYEESNPSDVWSQYVFAGGNLWEGFVTEKLKQMGLWRANNLKFQDLSRFISGEVDILIFDPTINRNIILEMKTFYGYNAEKQLMGTRDVAPAPKSQNLLQAFYYLIQFASQGIEDVALLYFARDSHKRIQFNIRLHLEDGVYYPQVSVPWRGGMHTYIDRRITNVGILDRYSELLSFVEKDEMPPPDFDHIYTDEVIEAIYSGDLDAEKSISKTDYENWKKNPRKNQIGYFMCRKYCNHRDKCLEDRIEAGEYARTEDGYLIHAIKEDGRLINVINVE